MNNQINKFTPELRFPEVRNAESWKEKTLEEVVDYENGKAHEQGIDINGKFIVVNSKFISTDGEVKKFTNTAFCLAKKGDILMVLSDVPNGRAIAKCFFVDKDDFYTVNQRICKLTLKKAEGKLLFYLLNRSPYFLSFDDGVKQTNLKNEDVLNCPLLIPKEPKEQQKIAECLSSLDEVIAAHSQKLEALKTHKKGLMQNLFPQGCEKVPKLRFKEFENNGEWVEKSVQLLIDEKWIVSHLDGNHGALYPKAEEFSKAGIPYITANDFVSGIIDFSKCKYLPLQKAKQFKKGVAKNGDILFAHNATVGPVAKLVTIFPFVILSTTATYFRCDNKNLVNDFLLYGLASPFFVKQYTRVMSQSTRNQVPITTQRDFILQLPQPKEQQKIASCLSSLDDLITAQRDRLEQLKLHKKGLMQGLFPKTIQ